MMFLDEQNDYYWFISFTSHLLSVALNAYHLCTSDSANKAKSVKMVAAVEYEPAYCTSTI